MPSASIAMASPAMMDSHGKPGIGTGGVGNGKPPGVVPVTVTVGVVTGAVTLKRAEAEPPTFVATVTTYPPTGAPSETVKVPVAVPEEMLHACDRKSPAGLAEMTQEVPGMFEANTVTDVPGGPDAGESVITAAVVVDVVVAALTDKASDPVAMRLPLVPWI